MGNFVLFRNEDELWEVYGSKDELIPQVGEEDVLVELQEGGFKSFFVKDNDWLKEIDGFLYKHQPRTQVLDVHDLLRGVDIVLDSKTYAMFKDKQYEVHVCRSEADKNRIIKKFKTEQENHWRGIVAADPSEPTFEKSFTLYLIEKGKKTILGYLNYDLAAYFKYVRKTQVLECVISIEYKYIEILTKHRGKKLGTLLAHAAGLNFEETFATTLESLESKKRDDRLEIELATHSDFDSEGGESSYYTFAQSLHPFINFSNDIDNVTCQFIEDVGW